MVDENMISLEIKNPEHQDPEFSADEIAQLVRPILGDNHVPRITDNEVLKYDEILSVQFEEVVRIIRKGGYEIIEK